MVSLYTLTVVGQIVEVPVVDPKLATHVEFLDVPTPDEDPAKEENSSSDAIQPGSGI